MCRNSAFGKKSSGKCFTVSANNIFCPVDLLVFKTSSITSGTTCPCPSGLSSGRIYSGISGFSISGPETTSNSISITPFDKGARSSKAL